MIYFANTITSLVELCNCISNSKTIATQYYSSIAQLHSIVIRISESEYIPVTAGLREILASIEESAQILKQRLIQGKRLKLTIVLLTRRYSLEEVFNSLQRQQSTLLLYLATESTSATHKLAAYRESGLHSMPFYGLGKKVGIVCPLSRAALTSARTKAQAIQLVTKRLSNQCPVFKRPLTNLIDEISLLETQEARMKQYLHPILMECLCIIIMAAYYPTKIDPTHAWKLGRKSYVSYAIKHQFVLADATSQAKLTSYSMSNIVNGDGSYQQIKLPPQESTVYTISTVTNGNGSYQRIKVQQDSTMYGPATIQDINNGDGSIQDINGNEDRIEDFRTMCEANEKRLKLNIELEKEKNRVRPA